MNQNENRIEGLISQSHFAKPNQIEVIFEFEVSYPRPMLYRGIKTSDGYFRVEKRGPDAKKFRTVMGSGTLAGLLEFRESTEHFSKRQWRITCR